MPATKPQSAKVFISYSHKDKEWLDRLNVHLAPIKRTHSITIWDDTFLQPGMEWDKEIKSALGSIQAAILLISPDFLASEYIYNQELPTILEAAADRGATIFSIVLSPCLLSSVPKLAAIQTVNNPKDPLINMLAGKRDEVFVQLAEQVMNILNRQPANEAYEAIEDPQEAPTMTDEIADQLLIFNSNPNRYLIVSVGDVYIQYLNYENADEILVEAVSNEFLPREEKLAVSKINDLLNAGFNKPDPKKGLPNYHRGYELMNKKMVWELAELSEYLLLCVYEIPGGSMLSFEHGNQPTAAADEAADQNAEASPDLQGYADVILEYLHLLNDDPTPHRFLVVSFEDIYMQYVRLEDEETIQIEAVSNKFLPKGMKLSIDQEAGLLEAGFQKPDKNLANFNMVCVLPDDQAVQQLASFTAEVLFNIYGLPPDADLRFEEGNSAA